MKAKPTPKPVNRPKARFTAKDVLIFLLMKWSGIAIVDGRGKVGGTVFSKSRAGATARNKVTPVNRRSAAQSLVRGTFTGFSQQWRTLTSSQINAWNAAASSGYTTTNIFGDTIHKSGNQLFISLNQNLNQVGAGGITDVPDLTETAAVILSQSFVADVSSTNMFAAVGFNGGGSTVPADNDMAVYATPPMSPGVRFVRTQLRYLTTVSSGADTAAVSINAAYVAKYGQVAVGDNVYLAAQCINTNSGVAGTPIQAQITISA